MNAMTRLTIPLPRISAIEVVDHLVLRVTWCAGIRNGRTDTVELSPLVNVLKFYRPIRDKSFFRIVHLIEDGRAIAWGDDDKIDMPAASLEQLAEESIRRRKASSH
jgi:hypothetical protein